VDVHLVLDRELEVVERLPGWLLFDQGSKGAFRSIDIGLARRRPEQLATVAARWQFFHLDVAQNLYGHTPTMDPRIVAIFKRWGFNWGGDFLIPDGMHFEFARFVRS